MYVVREREFETEDLHVPKKLTNFQNCRLLTYHTFVTTQNFRFLFMQNLAKSVLFSAPEKEMDMRVSENRRGNYVNISCWASRVFPKPRMTFYNGEQE